MNVKWSESRFKLILSKYDWLNQEYFCSKNIERKPKTIEKIQVDAPKIYKKELVELLFEQPYSKIEFVVNQLNVERKAASRYLKELEKIDILESQKVGRETLYINKKLIEILKK